MEELSIKTEDNVNIAANGYFTSRDELVIIAPGWCMTKDSSAFSQISDMFFSYYDVICFDFRGHGKSKGLFTFTSKEIKDLDAVIKFAKEKGYLKIYLIGFSLGGGIVLIYASQNDNVNKVISISAHSDFSKIENRMWKKSAWGETFKKFELNRFLSIRPCLIPYPKIKPIDIIKDVTVPTLFVAGGKDPTVYSWHTIELYNQAECEKQLKLYDNGFHAEDLYLHFREDFEKTCVDWLSK